MKDDFDAIRSAIDQGDAGAAQRLLPLVYEELRRIAHSHMKEEAPGQSLQTTALVHEAYLRLLDSRGEDVADWEGRAHFLSAAARAMRRILVDRARARGAIKRGGERQRIDLMDLGDLSLDEVPVELLDLDEALTRLAVKFPQHAELVSLRFFSGLTLKESAAVLGVSGPTADRYWSFARAWLLGAMEGEL